MSVARLIVCEKTSRWATCLRSELQTLAAPRQPVLLETRSLAQAEAAWRASPGAALAVEISATNLAAAVELLLRLSSEPQPCLLALLDPELTEVEGVLREAGATAIVTSTRSARRAARLILKHLGSRSTAPLSAQSASDLREAMIARLPWPRHASVPA